jgi:hypothetical protein
VLACPSVQKCRPRGVGSAKLPQCTVSLFYVPAEIGRPEFLPRRQVLYLDAIEESFGMASLAYERLRESLVAWMSVPEPAEGSAAPPPDAMSRLGSAILLDAWSLVDVFNRLRVLVDSMPGLKKSSPGVKSFLHSLGPIENLRNAVQHLYGEVPKIVDTGHPIWGSLSWAVPPVQPGDVLRAAAFVPGTLAPVKGIPVVNPVGRYCEPPVGLIELTAAGTTVSVSEMMAAVLRFGDRLERATRAAFAEPPGKGSGIVFDLDAS